MECETFNSIFPLQSGQVKIESSLFKLLKLVFAKLNQHKSCRKLGDYHQVNCLWFRNLFPKQGDANPLAQQEDRTELPNFFFIITEKRITNYEKKINVSTYTKYKC